MDSSSSSTFLGDNAGDKAVGKVLRVVEIVHL